MAGLVDENSEYRLLGSIIDRPDTVLAYTDELFTSGRVELFKAMRAAYLQYGDLSYEGVERFYGRMLPPDLEMGRGTKPAGIVDHLAELATKRQLGLLGNRLATLMAQSSPIDRTELSKMLTIAPVVSAEDSSIASGITGFTSDLMRKRSGQYRFISTGLDFLDYMLGGEWPRQALTIIMAQAGGGKTALVVQSILNMARMGIPSLFISLEMPKDKIIGRMVANISGVDGMQLKRGNITDEDQTLVDGALVELQGLDKFIHIVDRPGMGIEDILYQVKLHKELYDIQAVFIDYIQIIDRPQSENDVEALGHIAKQIRNAALSLDIATIALSQKNGQEGLQSVWGSRRIVHIADSIFEINIDTKSSGESRPCQLLFHKNRDGALGEQNCLYYGKWLRFV